MYRYTITFDASSVDESQLRDLLAGKLGVVSCAITRSATDKDVDGKFDCDEPEVLQEGALDVTALILQFAERVDMFAPREVQQAYHHLDLPTIARRCAALVERGKINRIAHGIYSRSSSTNFSDEEIEANRSLRRLEFPHTVPRAKGDRIIEFLAVGRDSNSIQEFLGVSRQRVHQKLDEMMRQGLVCRVPGPDGRFIYALDQRAIPETSSPEWPKLTRAAQALLSRIPDRGIIETKAAQASMNANYSGLQKVILGLTAKKLIETPRLGLQKCLALTDRGRSHPVRSTQTQRLAPSDPGEIFGSLRAAVLGEMFDRGALTAAELSLQVKEIKRGDGSISNLLGDMKKAGLIEKLPGQGRLGPYRLTSEGRDIVTTLRRFSLPLNEHSSETHIRAETSSDQA